MKVLALASSETDYPWAKKWLVEMTGSEIANVAGLPSERHVVLGLQADVVGLFNMLDQARRKLLKLQEVSRDLEAIASLLSGVRAKAEQSLLPQADEKPVAQEAKP